MFLAISGLFFMIAFMGVRQRSNAVQFTDSMRSLQSFIQRQQNEVYNGVNLRSPGIDCDYNSGGLISLTPSATAAPGASDNCTTVGKLIKFNPDTSEINIYPIVGRFLRQTVDETSEYYLHTDQSDRELIVNHLNAWALITNYESTYSTKWGTVFKTPASIPPVYWLGFIRSPGSSAIFPFSISEADFTGDNMPLFFDITSPTAILTPASLNAGVDALTNIDATYCYEGVNGQTAEIKVGGESDAVELKFDTDCI